MSSSLHIQCQCRATTCHLIYLIFQQILPVRFVLELLWKAPELLRNPNRDPTGTQKGDVYAFGLILYEMFGRKGPWGDMGCSSRGYIILKLLYKR